MAEVEAAVAVEGEGDVVEVSEGEVIVDTMTHEQKKEEEQAVIQRQIEQTDAQMERLDMMEEQGIETNKGFNMQELIVRTILDNRICFKFQWFNCQDMGIQITNVMEFSATIELSAPKENLYNFVSH